MAEESNKSLKAKMEYLSENAKDLLEEMLEVNPFFRPSVDEILQHPWFSEFSLDGVQSIVFEEMQSRREYIISLQTAAQIILPF